MPPLISLVPNSGIHFWDVDLDADALPRQARTFWEEPLGGPADENEGGKLVRELRDHVANEIGKIAKPRQIMVVAELPKTRSGKIMRRLLRDVADHKELGDVTTLTDSSVMDLISQNMSTAPPEE